MVIATQKFHFDAAHRLLNHTGKCRFLHGHRYTAEIDIEARELDKMGMVTDFAHLKKVIGDWINSRWDHNILLHENDPLLKLHRQLEDMPDYLSLAAGIFGDKTPFVFMAYQQPTVENMVRELRSIVWGVMPQFDPGYEKNGINSRLRLSRVTIHETPNCSATVHGQ